MIWNSCLYMTVAYLFTLVRTTPSQRRRRLQWTSCPSIHACLLSRGKEFLYFAEEVFSTHAYKQIIKADDRATMLNLMTGLNGYTLCSGIICQDLNGDFYVSVPLDTTDTMTIGYIKRKNIPLSLLGRKYIDILKSYK